MKSPITICDNCGGVMNPAYPFYRILSKAKGGGTGRNALFFCSLKCKKDKVTKMLKFAYDKMGVTKS